MKCSFRSISDVLAPASEAVVKSTHDYMKRKSTKKQCWCDGCRQTSNQICSSTNCLLLLLLLLSTVIPLPFLIHTSASFKSIINQWEGERRRPIFIKQSSISNINMQCQCWWRTPFGILRMFTIHISLALMYF